MTDFEDSKFSDDAVLTPPCWTCKHQHAGGRTCAAFPKGIPPAIRAGLHQHRAHYSGDNGVQYERMSSDREPPVS